MNFQPDRYYDAVIPAVAISGTSTGDTPPIPRKRGPLLGFPGLDHRLALGGRGNSLHGACSRGLVGWRIRSLGPRWINGRLPRPGGGSRVHLINLSRRPKMEWTRIWRPAAVGDPVVASVLIDGRQYAVGQGPAVCGFRLPRARISVVERVIAGLAAPRALPGEPGENLVCVEPGRISSGSFRPVPDRIWSSRSITGVSWYWQKFPSMDGKGPPHRVTASLAVGLLYVQHESRRDKGIFNKLRRIGERVGRGHCAGEFPSEMKGSSAEAWIRVNTGRGGPHRVLDLSGRRDRFGIRSVTANPAPDGSVVRSGDTRSIRITYTAPNGRRDTTTEWRLVKEGVAWFGDSQAVESRSFRGRITRDFPVSSRFSS